MSSAYFSNIKNYIFDLGGVLINLDLQRTFEGFAQLADIPVERVQSAIGFTDFWKNHETGVLSDHAFRDGLRFFLKKDLTDQQIDEVWNAMLLDIPLDRIQLLQRLGKRHRIFLLSNTNQIHYCQFTAILQRSHGISNFDQLFEKAYYSHILGMRKPDAEIYMHVLSENKLNAYETCFIDDNLDNIRTAQTLGLETIHITPKKSVIEYFTDE